MWLKFLDFLIILSKDFRYKWTHEISKNIKYKNQEGDIIKKPNDYRRISLTFRNMIK